MIFHRRESSILVVPMKKINCKECNEEIWVSPLEKEITCQNCTKRLSNETNAV